jgi:hypothetical protein
MALQVAGMEKINSMNFCRATVYRMDCCRASVYRANFFRITKYKNCGKKRMVSTIAKGFSSKAAGWQPALPGYCNGAVSPLSQDIKYLTRRLKAKKG